MLEGGWLARSCAMPCHHNTEYKKFPTRTERANEWFENILFSKEKLLILIFVAVTIAVAVVVIIYAFLPVLYKMKPYRG